MATWRTEKIKDICQLVNGKAFKPSEWSKDGLPIIRIQNLNNEISVFNYCNFPVEKKYYVDDGELLFAWSGTPGTSFGAHIWNGGKAVLNQHIFKVLINEQEINKKFFMHLLNKNVGEYIQKAHGTAGLAHITKGKFENSEIRLPTKKVQDEIVSVLETQLTRLDVAIKSLKALKARLEVYRKSVLKTAFEGAYTKVPFIKVKIMDVSLAITYGTSSKAKNTGSIPVLRMGNLQRGEIDFTGLKYFDKIKGMEDLVLEEGDILFNRTNSAELVGKTSIFRCNTKFKWVVFASYLIRIKVDHQKIIPEYLNYWMNSPQANAIKNAIKNQQVGQANINGTKLKNIEFPFIEDKKEQRRVVEEIEAQFSVIDKVKTVVISSLVKAGNLRKSILHLAFEGKLIN